MRVAYKIGEDVVVDLTDGRTDQKVLHYGTVCQQRRQPGRTGKPGGFVYRVSGLPRRWLPVAQLQAAPRPPVPS
jgi:hypothetical protein